MATPTVGATTTAITAVGNSIVIPVPTHAAGDRLVVAVRGQTSGSTVDLSCAGWTRIGPAFVPSSVPGRILGLWTKVAGGSEPGSYTFAGLTADGRIVAAMLALPKVGGVTPDYDTGTTSYVGTGVNPNSTCAMTTTKADALVVTIHGNEVVSPNQSAPTSNPDGFDEHVMIPSSAGTGASRTVLWVGSKTQASAGATGNITCAWASTSAQAAQVVSFWVDSPPTEVTATGTLTLSGTAAATTAALYVPQPWTVTEMDACIAKGYPVQWAHRGGSANWSEMTMYAYHRAVAHGARALEVSCHRSSDGVWIMSHDATTERVTATNHTIISTHSSTLLGIPVDTPGSGGVIGRLEDLLDAYPDRVLIIDNKPGSNLTEFYNLIKAHVTNWADHVIIKLYSASPPSTFAAAKAAGFKTASYLYDDSYATYLDGIDPHTDYHGLNYDASQGVWDAVLAKGKPTWGHVCLTQGHADTAIAKGAKIVQLADVAGVMDPWNRLRATAGVALAGTAESSIFGGTVERTATGALTLSGQATATASGGVHERTATGMLALTGSADAQAVGGTVTRTATGTLTLAGTAEAQASGGTVERTAAGALTLTGAADADTGGGTVARTATGTLALTGTADAEAAGGTPVRTATGTLTLTGTAATTTVAVAYAIGYLTLAGAAVVSGAWRDLHLTAGPTTGPRIQPGPTTGPRITTGPTTGPRITTGPTGG